MKSLLLFGLVVGPVLFIAGSTFLIGFVTPGSGTALLTGLGGLVLIFGGIVTFGLGLAESMHGTSGRLD